MESSYPISYSTIDFIKRSNIVHKNKYEYLSEYNTAHDYIKIKCSLHGEFQQKAYSHLNGIGCPKCGTRITSNKNSLGNEKFIKIGNEKHNFRYNYSKVNYVNNKTKITIICPVHGDFIQSPGHHMKGHGCFNCRSYKRNKTNDEFLTDSYSIHNGKYIPIDEYKGAHVKIRFNCEKHGEYEQTPNSHLKGRGCYRCNNYKLEEKWLDMLNISIRQYKIGKYKVDGYDPLTNTAYEFNGDYWHGNPTKYDSNEVNEVNKFTFGELYNYTIQKQNNLKELGYTVISIWESEFLELLGLNII